MYTKTNDVKFKGVYYEKAHINFLAALMVLSCSATVLAVPPANQENKPVITITPLPADFDFDSLPSSRIDKTKTVNFDGKSNAFICSDKPLQNQTLYIQATNFTGKLQTINYNFSVDGEYVGGAYGPSDSSGVVVTIEGMPAGSSWMMYGFGLFAGSAKIRVWDFWC